jgi:hypothetical protein
MVNSLQESSGEPAPVNLDEVGDEPLLLKRRELTLISERIFQHRGVPAGAWAAARNNFLDTVSQLGAEALTGLAEVADADAPVHPDGFGVNVSATGHRIDARHQHSLIVGAIVGNAIEGHLATSDDVTVSVINVCSPRYLAGLAHRVGRRGVQMEIVDGDAAATLRARGRIQGEQPSNHTDLVDGIVADSRLWWRIYNASTLALSKVTEISRFHTGNTPAPPRRRLAIK